MAEPIPFTRPACDPTQEVERRLAEVPRKHGEALLVAFDVLSEAHRQGILDALHGAIGARDKIAATVSDYAAEPLGSNALRNLLALGSLLGSLDPEPISEFSREAKAAVEAHKREKKPPSLLQLFERLRDPATRRGLSLLTYMLAALGKARKQ
jgi:uncharacterized protein YjgD (DUF1641 family)